MLNNSSLAGTQKNYRGAGKFHTIKSAVGGQLRGNAVALSNSPHGHRRTDGSASPPPIHVSELQMFKSDDSDGFMSADLPQNSIDVAVKNGSRSYAHVNGNHQVHSAMSPPLRSTANVRYAYGASKHNYETSY